MAEAGSASEVGRLAEAILEKAPPHVGTHIKAPEAVANKSIKAAAARLEREEMAASPTHTMRKRDDGGLASAVQEVAQHTARPDMNPVVAEVHGRVREMQAGSRAGAQVEQ